MVKVACGSRDAPQGFDTEDAEEQEARMSGCLDRVDLGYLLTRRGP